MESILLLAAKKTASPGAISRERLMLTAAELGITEEAVARAEAEFLGHRADVEDRRAFDRHIRLEFLQHVALFVAIAGGVTLLHFMRGGELALSWYFMVWALCVLGHATTLSPRSGNYRATFRKWQVERRRGRKRDLRKRQEGLPDDLAPFVRE